MIVLTFWGVFLVLFMLWSRTIHRGLKNLRCTRSFSRPAFFVGEEGELIETVRNDSPVLIPWILVESQISPYLRLGRQENLNTIGDVHFCSQFTLMPYQQIHRRHRVRFLRRGSYNLGNASLTVGDILGLSRYRHSQNLEAPVLVYPALLAPEDLPAPISNHLREITRRPQLLQDPFLIRGLRPYQPGDPVQDIHWPATARTNEVQIRLHDYSARTNFLVVLNAEVSEQQWYAQLSEQESQIVEYGISLAATACLQALENGIAAGFATNMSFAGQTDPVCMLPEAGISREEALLTAFARLKLLRTQPFLHLLRDLATYSDMDVLILSAYDSADLQTAAEQLRQSGNHVVICPLKGGTPCCAD